MRLKSQITVVTMNILNSVYYNMVQYMDWIVNTWFCSVTGESRNVWVFPVYCRSKIIEICIFPGIQNNPYCLLFTSRRQRAPSPKFWYNIIGVHCSGAQSSGHDPVGGCQQFDTEWNLEWCLRFKHESLIKSFLIKMLIPHYYINFINRFNFRFYFYCTIVFLIWTDENQTKFII